MFSSKLTAQPDQFSIEHKNPFIHKPHCCGLAERFYHKLMYVARFMLHRRKVVRLILGSYYKCCSANQKIRFSRKALTDNTAPCVVILGTKPGLCYLRGFGGEYRYKNLNYKLKKPEIRATRCVFSCCAQRIDDYKL